MIWSLFLLTVYFLLTQLIINPFLLHQISRAGLHLLVDYDTVLVLSAAWLYFPAEWVGARLACRWRSFVVRGQTSQEQATERERIIILPWHVRWVIQVIWVLLQRDYNEGLSAGCCHEEGSVHRNTTVREEQIRGGSRRFAWRWGARFFTLGCGGLLRFPSVCPHGAADGFTRNQIRLRSSYEP